MYVHRSEIVWKIIGYFAVSIARDRRVAVMYAPRQTCIELGFSKSPTQNVDHVVFTFLKFEIRGLGIVVASRVIGDSVAFEKHALATSGVLRIFDMKMYTDRY